MRNLTEQERRDIEFERDMLKGNINRMCITDDIRELYKQVEYIKYRILRIQHIAEQRFTDKT